MGSSTGTLLVGDEDGLDRVVKNINRRGAFHAEDEDRLNARKHLAREGDWTSHPEVRDDQTALIAVKHLVAAARKHRKRVHVLHVSSAIEMQFLATAKDVATVETLVSEAGAQHVFVMQLLSGFAAVAVLLASIGLYGVVSYTVAQRTREVGIRVALGARPGDVVRLVLSRGAALVLLGLAAGLAAALVTTRFLGTLVFGVSPEDPVTLATAVGVLAAVALGAHVFPVRRALRVDPATALRQE